LEIVHAVRVLVYNGGMSDKNSDFYQKLRGQISDWLRSEEGREHRWAEYLLFAPDLFHRLWKLSLDPDVPGADKAKLAGAIAYFVSPIDLLPEAFVGPAGYLDDIALAAYVLNGMLSHTDPEVLRRHWAGDTDVLEVIKRILAAADKMMSAKVLGKLKRLVGGR
jgi:uncharacterized membrane protein YkvA (DUF1232 family)